MVIKIVFGRKMNMKTISRDFESIRECLEAIGKQLDVMEKDIMRPERIFLRKAAIAQRYDISPDQIDKMVRCGVLREEVHYTRFTPGGAPMFYLEACDAELRPKHIEKPARNKAV
jgi:hypothetical protein